MKEISYDEWIAEWAEPAYQRQLGRYWATTGPKRKVHVLADQNLEVDLLASIQNLPLFKVYRLPDGTSDQSIWTQARHKNLLIFSADTSDFWNDRKYPLAQSPGLILLKGRTASEKLASLVQALDDLDLVACYRRDGPGAYAGAKVRACATTTLVRFVEQGRMIRYEVADRRGEGRRARSVGPGTDVK